MEYFETIILRPEKKNWKVRYLECFNTTPCIIETKWIVAKKTCNKNKIVKFFCKCKDKWKVQFN